MESFFFLVVLVVAVISAVLLVSKSQDRGSHLNRVYMQLARKYGGKCQVGGMWRFPKTMFTYNGSYVTLGSKATGNRYEPYHTLLRMSWPEPRLRCEVHDETMPEFARRLMGMQDIQTGDAPFDRRYRVTGSSDREVKQLLHEGVRMAIDRLRSTGKIEFHFSIRRGEMLLRKDELITDAEVLQGFVHWCLVLHDQAQLARAAGITFLQESSVEAEQEIHCQVCGEDIRHDMVHCRKCETPHHRDCWYYFGACSTFGCQEKQFKVRGLPPEISQSSREPHPG